MSCEKWLDVTPPSQIREEDQLNSVEGFQQSLTGCYIAMTDDYLYGRTLTWGTLEVMAGQFAMLPYSSSNDYAISRYLDQSNVGQRYVNNIWSKAYNVIANANNALKFIDINKDVLDNINYSIIKGELLAIRAYMHFDLMRLYGYGNLANRNDISGKFAVPYVTTLDKEMTPQLSYQQTMEKLIADLEQALELLEIDPLTGQHPAEFYNQVNIDGYFDNRELHLNYYATSLLLARVYMWEGSTENIAKAQQLSTKVMEESLQKGMVTWATSSGTSSNPLMSSEHIFALNTQNIYEKSASYYMLNINEKSDIWAQYISSSRLQAIYETEGPGNTDFRFSRLYVQNNISYDGAYAYTPIKYYGSASDNVSQSYIPLMRLPEAFYIAAESYLKQASPNVTAALDILNTVRANRGIQQDLTGLTTQEALAELEKEYKKEFIADGIMFFYYKRTGQQNIPGYQQEAGDNVYLLPYPNTEIQMGRNQ